MNFLTGLYAIDARASALNNGPGEETKAITKMIRVGQREYPYVSAQAQRFWLRDTLAKYHPEWQASPIARGAGKKQQAFTLGDPLRYWDDDLFGYMRAEKGDTLTRIAPFRTSTLVAHAPVEIVDDFGVMARMDGNPVLHGHEFYRAVLVGAFSIDLGAVGTFSMRDRTGYRNLNEAQAAEAEAAGMEIIAQGSAYRLPIDERTQRVASLLHAFGRMEGGAKQTLHYTDVSPAFVCMAVLRGGNNPFLHLLNAPTSVPTPTLHVAALAEALDAYRDDFQSAIYVGLRRGFMDSAYAMLEPFGIPVAHPRTAFDAVASHLKAHPEWMD